MKYVWLIVIMWFFPSEIWVFKVLWKIASNRLKMNSDCSIRTKICPSFSYTRVSYFWNSKNSPKQRTKRSTSKFKKFFCCVISSNRIKRQWIKIWWTLWSFSWVIIKVEHTKNTFQRLNKKTLSSAINPLLKFIIMRT
jgi:hypothetical protein